ncbi:MAG: ATP-binding domain-containing protein [Chitinivibrionia bacterium]|nr:ATP-binding domain-containing protein [Chitinivibrionia bacterium]
MTLHLVGDLRSRGYSLRDIAILYRTNAQSRSLEEVFKLGGMPYQIIGSVRFYERAEIRDMLAYCKLIVNPDDFVSLQRIINVPRRTLGKTTVAMLEEQAIRSGVSTMQLLVSGEYSLGAGPRRRCEDFVRAIESLRLMSGHSAAPKVIEALIDAVGYREHLKSAYPDFESRIENIEELVAAADSFADSNEDRSLRAFLEEIALVSDVDAIDAGSGLLTLMTVHNAKGLEFDCVVIAGLEDGLFPHYSSLDTESELEEERRLLYVGMTRARSLLCLSYANMRRRMGSVSGQAPSRFLFEIPERHLEGSIGAGLLEAGFEASRRGAGWAGRTARFESGVPSRQEHPDYENISQEETAYSVGMRVWHEKFGRGIVRKVEGKGEDLRVTVLFDAGSERKFIASYAPMRPL